MMLYTKSDFLNSIFQPSGALFFLTFPSCLKKEIRQKIFAKEYLHRPSSQDRPGMKKGRFCLWPKTESEPGRFLPDQTGRKILDLIQPYLAKRSGSRLKASCESMKARIGFFIEFINVLFWTCDGDSRKIVAFFPINGKVCQTGVWVRRWTRRIWRSPDNRFPFFQIFS